MEWPIAGGADERAGAPGDRADAALLAPQTALLYTPAQAAELLAVPESWVRRKAGLRLVPCTFVGKHLRFSQEDLRAIIAAGRRPAGTPRRARPVRRRTRGR
ncbi:helix-turn-helix domain-containing protein [Amycolatopsis coloradensis]|uniref:helix-turn-helix domain-containing protein n=1 Tax=Amycolatopsis coloradensis TaxID=76021 RepID=UPI00313441F0